MPLGIEKHPLLFSESSSSLLKFSREVASRGRMEERTTDNTETTHSSRITYGLKIVANQDE